MKTSLIVLSTLVALSPLAQPAERPGRGPGDRPESQREPGPPLHPLMAALDTNQDGELSSAEIENASAALKKLDRNNDGKVDRVELRLGGRGLGAGAGVGSRTFADRIMSFDQNGDGKVTREELPERMERVLERADTNQDGAIDKAEAEKLTEEMSGRDRPGRPGQDGGRGRPERPD